MKKQQQKTAYILWLITLPSTLYEAIRWIWKVTKMYQNITDWHCTELSEIWEDANSPECYRLTVVVVGANFNWILSYNLLQRNISNVVIVYVINIATGIVGKPTNYNIVSY